ncbi:MAG TPA: GNAT family N-acetyltransferase [Candidatus Lokiarchaeia archaeon]|nr:GNAT family N-acetyltransferase [Candidatus Lokiarchaeia archaeon]
MPELHDSRSYTIRQVRREDYEDGKYDEVHAWLREIEEFLAIRFEPEDLESNRIFWMRNVDTQDEKSHIILGAFLDDELIGQTDLGYPGETGRSPGRHVGAWGLAVKKEFHNQGVGQALLEAIEALARDLGLHKLAAEVVDNNEPAKALYLRKMGYEVEGRKKEHFLHDSGEFMDMLVIGKILD